MGTKIDAVGLSTPGFFRRGSIDMEIKAAKDCLKSAQLDPNLLGILINAGIYRDRHIGEPAIATFIQRAIGANELFTGDRTTFSFDLTNGGCGMLTGVMVVDGFLQSGMIDHGMVVTADTDPVPGESQGYNYTPAAAAVLLSRCEEGKGFIHFKTATEARFIDDMKGRIEWRQHNRKMKNILVMSQTEGFAQACAQFTLENLDAFLKETSLKMKDIDLIIPSQSPTGFLGELKKKKGMEEKLVDVTDELENVHTAGIGFALERARSSGRFAAAKNCLFLTVGAGITVSLALYRNL
ncbi:MAG: 3-oxoacyl-[acyl-carrier-protein] synthase III C-terminal domain-containing protein [Syntrophus sp. (in: bacteria)]